MTRTASDPRIYAATDAVLRRSCPAELLDADLLTKLRVAALGLQACSGGWGSTTTGVQPSPQYVSAARDLYEALARVASCHGSTQTLDQLYPALRRGVSDIAWITTSIAPQASRLINSQVLFAPLGSLPATVGRLSAGSLRRLDAVTATDLPGLSHALVEANSRPKQVASSLPSYLPEYTTKHEMAASPPL